jgi:hypothetical protein
MRLSFQGDFITAQFYLHFSPNGEESLRQSLTCQKPRNDENFCIPASHETRNDSEKMPRRRRGRDYFVADYARWCK